MHHDSRAIAIATREAGRLYSNILAYETPFTRDFTPKIYYNISDVIEEKVELLRLYKEKSRMSDSIRGLAEFRALQSRLSTSIRYVEAFDVVKVYMDREFKLQKVPLNKKEPQHEEGLQTMSQEPAATRLETDVSPMLGRQF